MNNLIDSDFQRAVDAMETTVPLEESANCFDFPEICSNMNWDFGLEPASGGHDASGMPNSWHCNVQNLEQNFDFTGESYGMEDPQADEDNTLHTIREDLGKIQAELQELKKTVENALELYGQRIGSTEKYIDDLLPWTVEVHGAIEQLTGRVEEADRVCQDGSSWAQCATEKD